MSGPVAPWGALWWPLMAAGVFSLGWFCSALWTVRQAAAERRRRNRAEGSR